MFKKIILTLLLMCNVAFAADLPSLPYNFQAKQIIIASRVMANYNALLNALTDGTSAINAGEYRIGGTTVIDSGRNASFETVTANNIVIDQTTYTTLNVTGVAEIQTANVEELNVTGNINMVSDEAPINTATSIKYEANATTGWTNSGMASFESTTNRALDGSYSIYGAADTNGDYMYVSMNTTVNENYIVLFGVYGDSAGGQYTVRVESAISSADYFDSGTVRARDKWVYYQADFDATTTTSYIRIQETTAANSCKVYVDSVRLFKKTSFKNIGDVVILNDLLLGGDQYTVGNVTVNGNLSVKGNSWYEWDRVDNGSNAGLSDLDVSSLGTGTWEIWLVGWQGGASLTTQYSAKYVSHVRDTQTSSNRVILASDAPGAGNGSFNQLGSTYSIFWTGSRSGAIYYKKVGD